MKHLPVIFGAAVSDGCAVIGHFASDPFGSVACIVGIFAGIMTIAQVIHNWDKNE